MSNFGAYSGPGAYPVKNVANAATWCERNGCQISQAARMLDMAQQVLAQQRRSNMSQALWCDATGHAFSERDPDRQRISISTLNEEGQEVMEARDFCGACAQAAGLLKRKTRPDEYDPLKTRVMEQKLGIGNGGE